MTNLAHYLLLGAVFGLCWTAITVAVVAPFAWASSRRKRDAGAA